MNYSHLVRVILIYTAVSSMLMSANVSAEVTVDQVNGLSAQVKAGDKKALETLITESDNGNKHAQVILGQLYLNGQGIPQDYAQAAQWIRKAAQQGDSKGQILLGGLYSQGRGVPKDHVQAAQWVRKAAEQGDSEGQVLLGSYHLNGYGGVPQDYVQAAQWYRKAAEQGNSKGQRFLGYLYREGNGVSKNKIIAYALISLSVAQESSTDDPASIFRTEIGQNMNDQESKAGQALVTEMSRPGNLLHAIDEYLANLQTTK